MYPETFHHRIRNPGSPAPKHRELLESYHGDLKSEEHIYPYPIAINPSVEKEISGVTSNKMSHILLADHTSVTTLLWSRGQPNDVNYNNLYLIRCYPGTAYHSVVNMV